MVALLAGDPHAFEPDLLIYVNRLSDLLFVMARRANPRAGTPGIEWGNPSSRAPTPTASGRRGRIPRNFRSRPHSLPRACARTSPPATPLRALATTLPA